MRVFKMFPIIILDDGANLEDQKNLKYLFSNSSFVVSEIFAKDTPNQPQFDTEREMVIRAFQRAKEINPESNFLIIKNTSSTAFGPEEIYELLNYKLKDFDLLYLCRWNDSCNLYRNIENFAGFEIATTDRPQGFQAILFSPKTRDMILSQSFVYSEEIGTILSKMIYNRFLKAKTVIYNVFNFNINYVRYNGEYQKFNQCSHVIPNKEKGVNTSTYFFVGTLIGLIVIAGVGLYAVGPKREKKEQQE